MTTIPVRFETLIERHHDEIYGYLYRLTHSGGGCADAAVETEDLTQEVFLRAYKAFGRLSPGSNHRAWLYKIATNCAYTALKRGQRHAQRQVPLLDEVYAAPAGEGRTPEGHVVSNERLESARREIGSLPPKQRAAVVLRYGQGLDYRAIAQALACSEDSARANVYQGLRRVRRALAAEGMENGGAG